MISPLLANIYLHWFDKLFHRADGPANWANARLVRYADDFVVMARYVGQRIINFVEGELEGRFSLEINRQKTTVVNLREPGASLNFLGYTFRYDRDLRGRGHQYLNCFPSRKSVHRERDAIRAMLSPRYYWKPLPRLVTELNRQLRGWGQYFQWGYPRVERRRINWYVRDRLRRHLHHRSQRPMRPPTGSTWYEFMKHHGLISL